MEEFYNRHYIAVRNDGAVINAWSDGPHPEKDIANAICINKQGGYQFRLILNGELTEENPPIYDIGMIPLYKWDGHQVVERTIEEIEAERALLPPPPMSREELFQRQLDEQADALIELAALLTEREG